MSKVFAFQGREGCYGSAYRLPGEPEGFRSVAEREAMTEGLTGLLDILSWSRPHDSETEREFIRELLLPAIREAGYEPTIDGFGNVWVLKPRATMNAGPCILWSCHVDTVAAWGCRQGVRYQSDGRTIELSKRKPGRCLGADDGAGVWLLLEMLRAGVPGGYVFHRGEEKGRLGSEYVAKYEPERLQPFDACIAFDRRNYADIITHQMGMRCASETFADTFSKALNAAGHGFKYRGDDTGSFTDSYSYMDILSECSNVSVGYDSEHGPRETLDGLHVWRLREALLSADFSGVICERDPADYETDSLWGYGTPYGSDWRDAYAPDKESKDGGGSRPAWTDKDLDDENLLDLIRRYPTAVAKLLDLYGLGCEDLMAEMTDSQLAGAVALVANGGGWSHD